MALRRLVAAASLLAAACIAWAAVQVVRAGPVPVWPALACVGCAAAGWSLHMSVRVGSQRLIFAWGAAAVAVALVLEPAWWVVLTTAAGMVLATFLPRRRSAVKAGYNSAVYTVGATAATLVYQGFQGAGPQQQGGVVVWAAVVARLLAAVACIVVVDVGVQTVLGVVAGKRWRATYRDDLPGRLLQAAAELGIVLCVSVAAALAPPALYAVPVLAVCLQLAHHGAVAASQERASARRTFEAIQVISAAGTDEVTVAQRAAEQLLALLTADAVEVRLPGEDNPPRHEVLVRATRDAAPYIGAPDHAGPSVAPYLAVQEQVGGDGPVEVRVYYRHTINLNERDTAAVRIVAAGLTVALATARAHADLALMAAQAAHEATHNHTTGLPDQRLLLTRINDHLRHDPHTAVETAALIVLNISGWPDLLNTCGPEIGDQILRRTARRLQDHAALGELVAHLGADTFAVYLTDATARQAIDRAHAILAAFADPIDVDTGPLAVTGVAGLAYTHPHEATGEELLRRARLALRQAHYYGRELDTYRPEGDVRGPAAALLRSDLHTALTSGQLEVHYEPSYDLLTGEPAAVEAFARWRHPDRGLIPDLAWIHLVDTSTWVMPYIEWLLGQALDAWTHWQHDLTADRDLSVPVTVNIPGRALLDPGLPAAIAAALDHAHAPRRALGIEIAETGALSSIDTIDKLLLELADHGTPITIDSAHSLDRLRRVPATEIKLAPEYSHDLATDDQTRAIISALVGLADQLDMRITATDITHTADAASLARLGVHCGQGTALQPPIPAAHIPATLRTTHPTADWAEIITLRTHRHRH